MSGISGVVHLDGAPVPPELLERMVQTISYRGPDGIERYFDGPVALAQLWLRTTPESQDERAPFTSESGTVVVGDIRLDNREELLGLLGMAAPSSVPLVGDLEIVGRAFDRWGADSVARFLGDFALAIWDSPKRTLHLARDTFGVRPLCWARIGDAFMFSSQPTGVLAHPRVPPTFDERTIANRLLFRSPDPEATFFAHVRRLPPAHVLSVTPRGVTGPRRYWDLPAEELRLRSDEEYAGTFRDLLMDAVRSRLRSSGKVGFDLSGGLDSSSVVGSARLLLGDDAAIRTFSVSIGGEADTDPEYRDAMVDYGCTLHQQIPSEASFDRAALRKSLGVPDDPFALEGPLFQGAEYLTAVDDGVRVLIGGMHGDTVVLHAYSYMVDLLLRGRWRRLGMEMREYARHTSDIRSRALLRYAIRPLVPRRALEIRNELRRRHRRRPDVRSLASDSFIRALGMRRHESWSPETTGLPVLQTTHRDFLHEIASDGAMDNLDTWSARAGLELRHPYTDRRLVEFCFALPGHQRFRDGWPRWTQRQAIAGLVPEPIRWRADKGRFAPDFRARILSSDWEEVTRLANTGGAIGDYIDRRRLRLAYESAGVDSPSSTSSLLWALSLERFVDWWTKPTPRPHDRLVDGEK